YILHSSTSSTASLPVPTTDLRLRCGWESTKVAPPSSESKRETPPIQHPSITSASSLALPNLPPSGPVPTKSVSQNWQTARDLSSSRPDQRLQPEKRQNTAARPVCAP